MLVTGLAPYLPPHRPRAAPRWWVARGDGTPLQLTLHEQAELPEPHGNLGLAAPCALPDEFLEFLNTSPAALTTHRLLARAREFAAQRERGKKHPPRSEDESSSALDRRRLPLFHAAFPLLHLNPIELDPPAFLRKLDLPSTGLAGDRPDAVDRRTRILSALPAGVLGFAVEVHERDYAIASHHALFAVLAAANAARA